MVTFLAVAFGGVLGLMRGAMVMVGDDLRRGIGEMKHCADIVEMEIPTRSI